MRRKIFFLIPSMRGGGAERVLSILLNRLDRKKFEMTLCLFAAEGVRLDDVPRDVRVIHLKASRARWAMIPIIRAIRRERPDLVFSAMGYLNILVAGIRPFLVRGTRMIARETIIPSLRNREKKTPAFFNWLYRVFYPRFDAIVCQSNDMRDDLVTNFSIDRGKIVVINNPVDTEKIRQAVNDGSGPQEIDPKRCDLVAAGRLEDQKGFDLLLKALSRLEPDEYSLTILGDGSLLSELQGLAGSLGLDDCVKFAGFQTNPYPYLAKADLFVLSSRFEGFPNVVLEAMSCGTPVVAFDCPGGVNEIIQEGVNGTVARPLTADALANSIKLARSHEYDEKAIMETVTDRYEVSHITSLYEKLLLSA